MFLFYKPQFWKKFGFVPPPYRICNGMMRYLVEFLGGEIEKRNPPQLNYNAPKNRQGDL